MKKILASALLLLSTVVSAEFIELETAADLNKAQNKIVILKVYGSHCGACRAIAEYFESLASEYPNITFAAIDADKGGLLSKGVNAVPMFFVYRDGKKISSEEVKGADQGGLKALAEKYKGKGAAEKKSAPVVSKKSAAPEAAQASEDDSSWESWFGLGEEKAQPQETPKSKKQMKKEAQAAAKKANAMQAPAADTQETKQVAEPKRVVKKRMVRVKSECVGGNCAAACPGGNCGV